MRSKVSWTGTKIGAMLRTMTGLLLTLAAAFLTAGFFSHSKLRIFVPLGFVVVLIAVSARFGAIVGVLGSLIAALVFAHRLFAPIGAVAVEELPARENLAWMILASAALSFLLFPPPERRSRR